jgi:hypothetical protein
MGDVQLQYGNMPISCIKLSMFRIAVGGHCRLPKRFQVDGALVAGLAR